MNPSDTTSGFLDKRTTLFLAVASGVFAVVVIAGLIVFGSEYRPAMRFDEECLAPEREDIRKHPDDATLVTRFREEDVARRGEYFRARGKIETGAKLLFISLFVFAMAMRRLAVLTESPPAPAGKERDSNPETERNRAVTSALAVTGPAVLATFVGIYWVHHQPEEKADAAGSGELIVEAEPELAAAPDHLKWPVFRGPTHQSVVADTGFPTSWNAAKNENILWKTKVPIAGYSSPIVWGDRIFLTGADMEARKVLCFDRLTGCLQWESRLRSRAFLDEDFEPYADTGLAAPTPVTDGRRVYALFATGELVAVDFAGKQLWSVWFGQPKSSYGLSSSPLIHNGKLILQLDQGSIGRPRSALYAVDPKSGRTLWKTARKVPSSWSSPIVIRTEKREAVITCADPFVIAYDPETGAELWRANVLDGGEVAPMPVYADGVVYAVQEGTWLSAIRTGGSGDVTKTHVLWQFDEGLSDCASPVTDGKLLVMAAAGYGAITCVDVKTGKNVWTQDFDNMFWSSPTLVGKHVYITDTEGITYIFELAREYKLVGKGDIGEQVYPTPAFVDSKIYMRGKEYLYCIGTKKP